MLRNENRVVYHADAVAWLQDQPNLEGCSIITSLPDLSEFPKLSLEEWKKWFLATSKLVLSKCPEDGMVLFYQTDIKKDGVWIDKSYLCQSAAEQTGHLLLAHKIICRAPVGTNTAGATGYSHLLCFSKIRSIKIPTSFPDVLSEEGEKTWKRGMGSKACALACEIVKAFTTSPTILDPFCGHGTVLAVANELGLRAIGVDHKLKNCEIAQTLNFKDLKPS